jgi:ClpP class serine protease
MNILDTVIQQVQQHNSSLLEKIKKERGNIVIPLFVHPITRATVNHVYNIINSPELEKEREKCKNPNNVDIILDSGGGDADAAYHIAKLLHRKFKGKINYIIPRYAKSAATLLVCGGDCIIMGSTSELGPLDPQIPQNNGEYISAKSVQATLNLIKKYIKTDLKLATIIASRMNPLVLGEYESTLKIAKEYQKELLFLRMFKKTKPNEKIVNSIVKKFAEGYTHHARIIDYEEAEVRKLNIEFWDEKKWPLIWELYMSHTQIIYLVKVMKILEKAKELELE